MSRATYDEVRAELAATKARLAEAEACISLALKANELRHGVHLGRPRMSGLTGDHAPCIFCILAGYLWREFDLDDYAEGSEFVDRRTGGQ